jgi:hypothetical protein
MVLLALLGGHAPYAGETREGCVVVEEGKMNADAVKLVRSQNSSLTSVVGLFVASMAVNTDGAPNSYHPGDFFGEKLAINRIDNAIIIRGPKGNRLPAREQIEVLQKWRSSGWVTPPGYRIDWKNVIAEDASGKPCIFKDKYAGYFGSLTALKNGFSSNAAGECQVNNQMDERFIPGVVLRGSSNPLKRWGAGTGDLVLVINPKTRVAVPAVIIDTGDGNRIGEGSVALNMSLLGKTDLPTTYSATKMLDTGNQKMIVAVIPKTKLFNLERPYSAKNIATRVNAWAEDHYGSQDALQNMMLKCAAGF